LEGTPWRSALAKLLQIGVLFGLQFTASRLIVFSRHAG
jgi:hypothetical protein